jgi:hypothetical protein
MEQFISDYRDLLQLLETGSKEAITEKQNSVSGHLGHLAQVVGLKATIKSDTNWVKKQVESRTKQMLVKRIRDLAAKIASCRSFRDESVKAEIALLAKEKLKDLKEVAKSLELHPAGTKAESYLLELLEKASGISSVLIDESSVASHVKQLLDIYGRSQDSLPEKEIKQEIKLLRGLEVGELAKIAEEFGLDQPGKKKTDIIRRIENKLKATYRANLEGKV